MHPCKHCILRALPKSQSCANVVLSLYRQSCKRREGGKEGFSSRSKGSRHVLTTQVHRIVAVRATLAFEAQMDRMMRGLAVHRLAECHHEVHRAEPAMLQAGQITLGLLSQLLLLRVHHTYRPPS